MARIGFIGLGNMGGGMAVNLAKGGHDVHAFDLSQDALDKARAAGCLPVESAAAAAEGAEAIVTMLPAGKHVAQVYEESLFGAAMPGTLLLDCSTIDVGTAKKVAESPRAGTIAELLLEVTSHGGAETGRLARVTHIQRLQTTGGVAPARPCRDGEKVAVRYGALYVFLGR